MDREKLFTPGPWYWIDQIGGGPALVYGDNEDGGIVIEAESARGIIVENPNDKPLLSAAPELLNALEQMVEWPNEPNLECAKRVISKAYGEDYESRASKRGDFARDCQGRTIWVGDVQVPEPLREAPAKGTRYYYIDPIEVDLVGDFYWDGQAFDYAVLRRGLCYLNKEDACETARALIEVLGGDPDAWERNEQADC